MLPLLLAAAVLAAPVPAPRPAPPLDLSWVRPVAERLLWEWEGDRLGYPPAHHLQRFPSADIVRTHQDLANAHQCWLQDEAELDPAARDAVAVWLDEARVSGRPWQLLARAQLWQTCTTTPWRGVEVRESLAELRDALGEEAYAEARMPPPVPLAWFRRRD